LAATYGGDDFWSPDPAIRARSDCWMDWSQTALQPTFHTGVFWGFYRTPEADRDWTAIRASLDQSWALFSLLDRILTRQAFLGGETLSLADIPAGGLLYRYFELDIDRPNLTNLAAWYARLTDRRAYRANVMIPFEEFRGRLAY
jgi:glutathione S-transferase